MEKGHPRRVLLISNGHGEDEIAAVLGGHLLKVAPEIDLVGFPLVGTGRAYLAQGINVLMETEILPSGGFTRNSLGNFLTDLKAGLPGQIRAQIKMFRKVRDQVDLAVGVGDVYLLALAGYFLKKPLYFLPTAKSDFIEPHLWIEKWIMRRFCRQIFPRDARTAQSLASQGLPANFAGNLMMDCLNFQDPAYFRGEGDWVITLLPGSRLEAYDNMTDLAKVLVALEEVVNTQGIKKGRRYFLALAGGLSFRDLGKTLAPDGWVMKEPAAAEVANGVCGRVCRMDQDVNLCITVVQGRFADLLAASDLVLGLAGTGNEQAVGLGKPVVTFPGRGAQFTEGFARRQKRLLGDSICLMERKPAQIAREVLKILSDASVRERMGKIGRARMGNPGGAHRIALMIKEFFQNDSLTG